MPLRHPVVIVAITLVLVGSADFAGAVASVRTNAVRVNPFAQPLVISPVTARAPVKAASASGTKPAPLQLRGVMQAGKDSFANVDGVIVGLGELVAGMRLRSVTESSAVFLRGGKKVVLEVSSGPVAAAKPDISSSLSAAESGASSGSAAVPERALAGSTTRELAE